MTSKECLNIVCEEYQLNCGAKSISYNLLYPNYCYRYLLYLRLYEYCRYGGGKTVLHKIASILLKRKINKWSFRTKIEIPTFTIGRGLKINHTTGGIIINSRARIGRNCYLSTGVVIGQDNIHKPDNVPIIGDNVHLAPNCKVFGRVTIGNNVIIGTDCVVMHDIPDNCCVVGNPARIVRQNGNKCNIPL